MSAFIEDYGLLSDTRGAALVSRDGSIDWLCLPRFDSPACFAALLGTEDHGRWLIAPAAPEYAITRSYRPGSMVLDTTFSTDTGQVTISDALLLKGGETRALVRLVSGQQGRVSMRTEFVLRPDYGSVIPWVTHTGSRVRAIAGPDAYYFDSPVPLHGERWRTVGEFEVAAGDELAFVLQWHPSHLSEPPPVDAAAEVVHTDSTWRAWASHCSYEGKWREPVQRSLLTLKALTYSPTGGIIAAATTSLPEEIGGVRNWDYRFSWIRDAAFTLTALLNGGFVEEAYAWRDWLLRAAAGHPGQLQVLYGLAGERRVPEQVLDWLPGYENSRPVRVGNAAAGQFQLDIYGEVIDMLSTAHAAGMRDNPLGDQVSDTLLEFLADAWRRPDEGIWEVRGPNRHFTHSKVMAWVAADRATRALEEAGSPSAERWRRLRDEIHAEVCERGVDPDRGIFVQSYDSDRLDAALLVIPLVGFLPASDPRVVRTVDAIAERLTIDGFVRRYEPDESLDGLPGDEGAFLLCTLWLAECYLMLDRRAEAVEYFERVLDVRNDLGLLAEEYDPVRKRLLGNFPQAFSHIALVNAAYRLEHPAG